MSQHNPELAPENKIPIDTSIRPDAPDFVEHPEPVVEPGHDLLPIWLYLLCGFALFMAGSSFVGFGNFGSGIYDQGPGAPALTSDDLHPKQNDDPMSLGKRIYNGKCANCHQASGAGQPGSYPPMVDSEYVLGSKDRLAALLLHGISGSLTVHGSSYGSQQMPGWSSDLTDQNLADLMTYLRGGWTNKGDAVKADEVGAVRTKVADHANPYSEADLTKMPATDAK